MKNGLLLVNQFYTVSVETEWIFLIKKNIYFTYLYVNPLPRYCVLISNRLYVQALPYATGHNKGMLNKQNVHS